MKHKVLWVEDGAFSDLVRLSAPVYVSGEYDLVTAIDASEGFHYLMEKEFNAVIVDIRLPPGRNPEFISLYNRRGSRDAARLGLALLRRVLQPPAGQKTPPWIRADLFGVFTVEGKAEVQPELLSLGVKVYQQKTERMSKTVLIDIIENIRKVAQRNRG
jgi:DNA-binding NarL/FixJ family response regulator